MIIDNINEITKDKLINKIIAFPTDTVYGIGALIDDEIGIKKVYQLKKRDFEKPLPILAGSVNDILPYIVMPNDEILDIMNKYWPGALTIVFKKSDLCKKIFRNNLDTVGFRIPNEKDAIRLLKIVGPLATTSVNLSGEKPLNDALLINSLFGNKIDYIYNKKVISSDISSTVIDCSKDKITILRQGEIKIK